jgi:effector-binding domain-containing protein
MSVLKKALLFFGVILLSTSIWYFFVKTNDFEVVIHIETAPGTVYQNILNWNKNLNADTKRTAITKKQPFHKITNTYKFEDRTLEFDWNIHKINDSVTKVSVGINDPDQSIATRFKKLIGNSTVAKLLDNEFSGFNEVLTNHVDRFDVVVEGEAESPEFYVAYINVSCAQEEKANNMISSSAYINAFLVNNDIKLLSNPFVEITDWSIDGGLINFNFCFPIEKQSDFPIHKEIKYKKVSAKKSVKATFYGNYSFSDNAWFTLYQYIKDNKLTRKESITEVFLNNPHTAGGKDSTWKALIYMEIE